MLGAASVLRQRNHEVTVLASGATRDAAEQLGFAVVGYRRAPDPDVSVAFEERADLFKSTMAGAEIALDTGDLLDELRPDLAVIDCMLPAAIAAAQATRTPTVSLVHFLYGPARQHMVRSGDGLTTDLQTLAETQELLGLPAARDGLTAWEGPELLLVAAPRWFDLECGAPAHVVHAGPLGVAAAPPRAGRAPGERPRVLLSFSTSVIAGQREVIDRCCEAVAGLDVDAVLTLGPAVDPRELRIPDNVEAVAFADHDDLMPEMDAVISHAGLGTVLRALAHGVPQLLMPLGRDQGFNAGRIEELGLGIHLTSAASPERIQAGLRALLSDPEVANASASAARRIVLDEPERTAAEAFERTARS